ncbi:MAG: iron-sulfur cluster assembly scaffold protein [Deltaproteobacteria bacterium]|jgi:nitrogen fixation protein NifU and related proteins|nr:iron-sulfur cluster assembly scaffold protein [Deltaproteobacteria bacterium]MBT6338483.1 iron-sulfur cluster assembly scaffold protein [Desulfobacula sp.]
MSNDIYHDPIIAWSKRKEHMGTLEKADCRATENNPLCGDRISVGIKLQAYRIKEITFHVRGCILAKASAAHLAFLAAGLDLDTLGQLRETFAEALKSKDEASLFPENHHIFNPVRSRKSRHSCVLLPYDAALQALRSVGGKQVHHDSTLSAGFITSNAPFDDAHCPLLL